MNNRQIILSSIKIAFVVLSFHTANGDVFKNEACYNEMSKQVKKIDALVCWKGNESVRVTLETYDILNDQADRCLNIVNPPVGGFTIGSVAFKVTESHYRTSPATVFGLTGTYGWPVGGIDKVSGGARDCGICEGTYELEGTVESKVLKITHRGFGRGSMTIDGTKFDFDGCNYFPIPIR